MLSNLIHQQLNSGLVCPLWPQGGSFLKMNSEHTLFIYPAFLVNWDLHPWCVLMFSCRTSSNTTFMGSSSPFAVTQSTTVKLCLLAPHETTGTVLFLMNSNVLVAGAPISLGSHPCWWYNLNCSPSAGEISGQIEETKGPFLSCRPGDTALKLFWISGRWSGTASSWCAIQGTL